MLLSQIQSKQNNHGQSKSSKLENGLVWEFVWRVKCSTTTSMHKIWTGEKQVMECTCLVQVVNVTLIHRESSMMCIKVLNLMRMMW